MALISLYITERSRFNIRFPWRRHMRSSMCHIWLLRIKKYLSLCFKCTGIKSIEIWITSPVVLHLWVLMAAVTEKIPHHHPTTTKVHKLWYNRQSGWKWMRWWMMKNSRRPCGSTRNLAPPKEWCSNRRVIPISMRVFTREMNLHMVWRLIPQLINRK